MRFQGQEDKGKAVKKENHSSLLLLYISELCWLYTFRRFDVAWIKKYIYIYMYCNAKLDLPFTSSFS